MKPREPGVYFDLPAEEYHADPSLSFSGIKHLMISPLAFWINSPMNPDYEQTETAALIRGQAYHARILEGEDAFRERFYVEPQKADYPQALDTVPVIKDRLNDLDVKVPKPEGGAVRKEHLVAALRQADPDAVFWDDVLNNAAEGRVRLSPDEWRQIERAARLVERHRGAQQIFSEGHPEVSVFWRDEATGCPLRVRFDWWAPNWIAELKTFSNSLDKPIERCLVDAILNNGYRTQAALQLEAARIAPSLLTDEQKAWFKPDPHPDYVWLFVGTDIPHVRARGFQLLNRRQETGHGSETEQLQQGRIYLDKAIRTYMAALEVYGTDIWADQEDIKVLRDEDFPVWSIDLDSSKEAA